ncbi:hypothetical protein COT99_00025 [Candidatus Falkowbacteria bacterium CG10_big_fil_rev_8_21_14_0_10_43_10]|uniref:N-acetyltransferase domain-containing protein n=1 Tax=Candidatus Falkowbacteria bacterium CG10_big_fil_rev_8_21_14_0_10_43_10 TaxID=1974567 RepID=A0A2H0V382_9BACT|nr:MAG: hypothetical protein COT99_00025 [Candidatus Falkowbacteria bacterium CG10_big_fil_rev_8_21_14_0_10_43_10]
MSQYKNYISKDYIIRGSLLALDKNKSWDKLDKRMRTAIRKARTFNPVIKQAEGNKKDVKKFYEFCPPNREDLPEELDKSRQWMFFAYINNKIAGGIIVTEVDNNLFMHFNAVTKEGREKQISSLLIWSIVETFHNSKYQYLDIGASYKPALQKYFTGWATDKYSVIMRPPEYKPQINIYPFNNSSMLTGEDRGFNVDDFLQTKFNGREYNFFPRGMYAIYALFKWFKLQQIIQDDQEVYISTTTDSPYISSCVTSAIEQAACRWSREISPRTKVVFVIHEFGFFNDKATGLKKHCRENNLILVEDCAYAWQSGPAGGFGDYLIYSLSKFFPMQFGAFLVGKKFDFKYIWDNFACADAGKEKKSLAELSYHLPREQQYIKARTENYRYLESIFGKEKSFFNLKKGEVPGAFVLKIESAERAKEISEFVKTFGIECGNYYSNQAIFLPVHQNLNKAHLDYIAGAVRAMYREGCGL